jgi:addiction module HigA family antidote
MSISNSLTEAGGASPLQLPGDMTMKSIPAGPRKVAPPHPGEILATALEDARVSLRQAAKAIGMSPTGLNKVLLGQSPVTPATALRISAYIGSTPELWLRLQAEYDLWFERQRLADELKRIEPASGTTLAA